MTVDVLFHRFGSDIDVSNVQVFTIIHHDVMLLFPIHVIVTVTQLVPAGRKKLATSSSCVPVLYVPVDAERNVTAGEK